MAKFLKSLFQTNTNEERKPKDINKQKIDTNDEEGKEFSAPYDTRRKLSISRSGRMKQNLKLRGKLNDSFFEEIPQKKEKTSIEYRVNKRDFFDNNDNNKLSKPKDNIAETKKDLNTRLEAPHENGTTEEIKEKKNSEIMNDRTHIINDETIKNTVEEDEGDVVEVLDMLDKNIQSIKETSF